LNQAHLVSFRIDTLVVFAPRIALFPFTLFYPALISYPHVSRRMTMARPIEPAMTVRDVAKFLNVGNITVYRLVQAGELPGFKVAGSWRFQEADIRRWIEERKQQSVKKLRSKRESKR
jgi:excisionase family DNA binding protein